MTDKLHNICSKSSWTACTVL